MKPKNLISVFQGEEALEASGLNVDRRFISLKKHEIQNVGTFCQIMAYNGCRINDFDGFFVGYTIAQLGKEFDLLRFGKETIINIEIKSELKTDQKEAKILKQLKENHYYLRFLRKPARLFAYVDNDGFYEYNAAENALEKVTPDVVALCLKNQVVDYLMDPDQEFIPSNYLISPFNSTEAFVAGEYFLTNAQQEIKNQWLSEIEKSPFAFFCISANAGTGKTLLLYDIAKTLITGGKKAKVIHCGTLNDGHKKLNLAYKWNISSISAIPYKATDVFLDEYDVVLVDEAQRISTKQLAALTGKCVCKQIPVFFSYDIKQYLKVGETRDVAEYLSENYPDVACYTKKLTNKIRTNKAMASFITNMMEIGKSPDNRFYDCVTVDYIGNMNKLKEYVSFLSTTGWTPITYTTSQYDAEPYDHIRNICEKNAHAVIGQEFSKVVVIMDENFSYGDDGRLKVTTSYYSARGMLYQIATRVVDELKIIVFNNPALYLKLMEIKALGE